MLGSGPSRGRKSSLNSRCRREEDFGDVGLFLSFISTSCWAGGTKHSWEGQGESLLLLAVPVLAPGSSGAHLPQVSRAEGSARPWPRSLLLSGALGAVGRKAKLAARECGAFSAGIIGLNAEQGELRIRGEQIPPPPPPPPWPWLGARGGMEGMGFPGKSSIPVLGRERMLLIPRDECPAIGVPQLSSGAPQFAAAPA